MHRFRCAYRPSLAAARLRSLSSAKQSRRPMRTETGASPSLAPTTPPPRQKLSPQRASRSPETAVTSPAPTTAPEALPTSQPPLQQLFVRAPGDGPFTEVFCIGDGLPDAEPDGSPRGGGVCCVIIPGNPGCGAYYETYARELHRRLSASAAEPCTVAAISLPGHALDRGPGQAPSPPQPMNLDQQINHLADLLRSGKLGGAGGQRLVLIGHSIGAHVALQAAVQAEAGGWGALDGGRGKVVAHVLALMPFMRFDWAEREPVRLRRLTWTPWLFGAVFAAVSLLPLAVRAAIIGRMTKRAMSARSVEVTARNITWDQGMNSAVLGRSEFVGLDKEPDWAMLQRWGREGRLTSFFAPEDPWAPARFERDMLRLAPAVRCKLLADQVHGFCVVDAMASKVAAETAAVVREHVGGFGPEGDTAAPYETEVGPGRDKPGVVHPGEMEFF